MRRVHRLDLYFFKGVIFGGMREFILFDCLFCWTSIYLSNACGRNFCQHPCIVTQCNVCIGWTYIFVWVVWVVCLFVFLDN